jgi:hypothetical protein
VGRIRALRAPGAAATNRAAGSDEWVVELAEIGSGRFKRFADCTRTDLLAALELAIARHQARNAVLRSLADHRRG